MSVRPEEFGDETACADYVFRSSDGVDHAVRARVGQPYKDDGSWACPVEISGFEPRYVDVRGEDSMQALGLALALMMLRMQQFVELGGTILDRDGHAYTIDELRRIMGR